jgi:hypothetical protein
VRSQVTSPDPAYSAATATCHSDIWVREAQTPMLGRGEVSLVLHVHVALWAVNLWVVIPMNTCYRVCAGEANDMWLEKSE